MKTTIFVGRLWITCAHTGRKSLDAPFGLSRARAHGTFLLMKNLAVTGLRFLLVFCIALAGCTVVWMTGAMLARGTGAFLTMLYGIAAAAVPLAVTAAAFMTFFLLNRILTSRMLGYALVSTLASLVLLGSAMLVRWFDIPSAEAVAALPPDYQAIGRWMTELARSPWPEFAAGIASFSVFTTAFWGCTRLSRSRPLIGAFIAPSGAIAALYLFSVYLSGPADAMLALIGLRIPRMFSIAMLTGASALALMLFDMLFARKPSGGRRDA